MSLDQRTRHDAPPFHAPPPGPITEEAFLAWYDEESPAEWVRGEVIMMTPVGGEHGVIVQWLSQVLGGYIGCHRLGRLVIDVWVRLAEGRTRLGPDLSFLTTEHAQRLTPTHIEGPPDLVIEVVSPASTSRDWREKYLEYEAAGVREYWVIDPQARRAEFYTLQQSVAESTTVSVRTYRRLPETDGYVGSVVLPGLRLRLAWLWSPQPEPLDVLRVLGVLPPRE